MPLTRNQQAALQASGQGHAGTGDDAEPHNAAPSDGQASSGMMSEATGGRTSKACDGIGISQEMASLNHHTASNHSTDWVSSFANPGSSLSDDVFTHDNSQSAFDPSPSSSVLFYRLQPNGNPALAQQVNQGTSRSPFYTDSQGENQSNPAQSQFQQQEQHQRNMQQQHQRERSMTTNDSFMAGLQTQMAHLSPGKATFEHMAQRPSVFSANSFHGGPPVNISTATQSNDSRQDHSSALGPAFSTPQPVSKTGLTEAHHDHSRTYSLDRADPRTAAMQRRGMTPQQQQLMQLHRTPGSADSSLSMDMGNVEMLTHISMQSASPLGHTISSAEAIAGMRPIERHQRSLGQVSAGMTQPHSAGGDGIFRLTNGNVPMRTIDTASLEPFGMHLPPSSQPNSPPEHDMHHPLHPNQPTFMGNFSPMSSVSHSRHMGDSSIDTSTGSISNSATTMSAVHSQASSISSDFLGGNKKNPKVKTKLRNIDRKAICEAARDDPRIRQEDLAVRFNIERSTVSKTLKNKEKWLAIDDEGQHAMIVKHRSGKFPNLEERLAKWIQDEVGVNTPVLDVAIKHRALAVAKELGIGMDDFKASVGWIDKFRERHGLPKFTSSYATISMDDDDMRTASRGDCRDESMSFNAGDGSMASQSSSMPGNEDVSSLYTSRTTSPPNGMVPTASTPQRPRSISMERVAGAQETPKASKRVYDDMATVSGDSRSAIAQQASIDAGMARMHLPASASGRGYPRTHANEGERKGGLTTHPHDDSGYAAAATKVASSVSSSATSACDDAGDLPPPSSSAKRRKGRHDGAAVDSSFADGSNGFSAESRSHVRRANSSNMLSRSNSSTAVAAVAAAAEEIRHSEEAHLEQSGSLAQRQSSQHSGNASPHGFAGTPPTRSDLLGMMQSAEATAASPMHGGASSFSASPSMEDRPVTLEEARLSLDVVLAFFERQPANLSRSDVFVLGNLQGQLSILANQQGQDAAQAGAAVAAVSAAVQQHHQQQQRQHHLASRQQGDQLPQHQPQQQPQHSGLNMLGLTGGDITLVGEMDHRAR